MPRHTFLEYVALATDPGVVADDVEASESLTKGPSIRTLGTCGNSTCFSQQWTLTYLVDRGERLLEVLCIGYVAFEERTSTLQQE